MWIPHFLLEFWEPETDEATITASKNDAEKREFELIFFLENPPTRQTSIDLSLEKPIAQGLNDGKNLEVKMFFRPNKDGRLAAINCKIVDTNPKNAFRQCHNALASLFSVWTLDVGSGISVIGLQIIDPKHQAKWKIIPQRALAQNFYLQEIVLGPEHAAVLSLYREARNADSPFYRFLCCYKILEAWHRNRGIFSSADRLIKEKGLSFKRPRRRIDQDMLNMALVFKSRPEFINKTFGEFFDLLNPWRVKVAHAITDSGDFINMDKYESQMELGPLANLADLVARQVLLDEFELWRKINDAGLLQINSNNKTVPVTKEEQATPSEENRRG